MTDHSFVFLGRQFFIAPRDKIDEGLWTLWVKEHAMEALAHFKDDFSPDEIHDFASYDPSWGSPLSLLLMYTPVGAKYLARLMLSKLNLGVTPELVELLWEDDNKWAELCFLIAAANTTL